MYAIPRGLAIVPLDGGEPRQLTTDGGANPVWPPTGSPIAYLGRDRDFWSVAPDGSVPSRLTAGAAAVSLTVSPNGRWIAYDRLVSDPHLQIVEVGTP